MNRICPECQTPLVETELYRQQVDRCTQCNGIYFDQGELESILKLMDCFTQIHLDEEDIKNLSDSEQDRTLHCPEDGNIMFKQDVGEHIVIDICAQCKGIWLDDREVGALKRIEAHIRQYLNLYIKLGS